MAEMILTRTQHAILGVLAFRADLGQSYFVHAGRGRYALVVPEMASSPRLARLDAYNWSPSIQGLVDAGLITVAQQSTNIQYGSRRRLDMPFGDAVSLTDAGRALVATRKGTDRG